jgi:hypothetical protein
VVTVAIVGGRLSAAGVSAAGIGAGEAQGNASISAVASLEITNGEVSAVGQSGAGIGAGYGVSSGTALIGALLILNGRIDATGSAGAGIGAGDGYLGGKSTVGSVKIAAGVISARGGSSGAGIGGGYASASGSSGVGQLSIAGGAIAASSAYGAGIGAAGKSSVAELTIANANVTATGVSAPAVGGGPSLVFEGNVRIDVRSDGYPPVDAGSIRASKASIVAVTTDGNVFGTAPQNTGSSDLVLLYGKESTSTDAVLAHWTGPLLQVGKLNLSSGRWKVCLSTQNYEKCFELDSPAVKSFAASLPTHGNYVLRATSVSRIGHLESKSGAVIAVDGFAFVPELDYVDGDLPVPSRTPDAVKSNKRALIIGVSIGGGVVVIIVLIVGIVCCRRKRKDKMLPDPSGKQYTGQYGSVDSTGGEGHGTRNWQL